MDGTKKSVSVKVAAAALLFLLSLSIAENLGLPISIAPNQTQASANHYNYNASFNVTLFANATSGNLADCNASITLPATEINFTTLPNKTNTTSLGNIQNQSVINTSWSLTAIGRGYHNLNFSVVCNGTLHGTANTTVYVDLLNITSVNIVSSPASVKWNDSYLGVYRNTSYNISITVANIVPAQNLTNVIVYLNDTNSSAFSLNSGTNTTIFAQYNASAPAGSISEYTLNVNDSQGDRLSQPLIIRILSPLNASITFNDSAIVVNQSFTATATATNFGPLNLTSINISQIQYDTILTLTNSSCQVFNLTPQANATCSWTFNSTSANTGASINITGTSAEGDNNTYPFSTRIYGWGSFNTSTNISFGIQNHSSTATQSVTLNASAAEDLVNFGCTAAGELNTGISCQSLSNLSKLATVPLNISLTIPQYTSKGMHNASVSIYAENANPFVVNYSVNVTGIKKCSLNSPVSAARATGATSTGLAAVNITNQGNVNITTVSCGSSGCNQIQSPSSPLTPGNSAIYNISATTAALSSTSTTFLVNCTSSDTDAIDGGTSNNLTITHPSGESSGSDNPTNTPTNNPAPQTPPSNATTYTYTVGILPATVTINKGESAEFTIEIKNTGTGALANLTVSGEATLQFSVTPTKITSIAKGQAGYSKITVTTTNATASGEYKVKAKVCRTTTSCITSEESTITIPADAQPTAAQNVSVNNTQNVSAPASKNATLNITTEDNSISLQINATNATNVTAYLELLDNSGKVVYNSTVKAEAANGSANYNISLPQTLKAGNYTLKVALKDFAGNTLAEKSVSYTAKANDIPTKTAAAALTALFTPNIVNGLLIVIMALFIIAGIKTSKIGGTIKSTLNIKQKILDKAQTAYQQGEYGKAREYRTAAESASSTERELMRKIGDSEKRIVQLYREGRHLQARKEQESLSRMRKELEILREQHGK